MKYTAEQLEFIHHTGDRILLDAPAGTGKTETIAERVRVGVEAGKKIQLTCFTHAARKTLQKRLDEAGIDIEVRTVVSLAHSLLVEHYGDVFTIGDGEEIAKDVCARTPVSWKQLLTLEGLNANSAPLPANTSKKAVELYRVYTEKKREAGYFTFIDAVIAATGLREYGWDELVIDEAQDITPTQLRMLQSFGAESMTMAGDPSQAIFGFSGVDVNLFDNLLVNGWERVSLTESFRVPSSMLPVVNVSREESRHITSVNRGGSVKVVETDFHGLAEKVAPMLKPGDVVLGLAATPLKRVMNRLMKIRPSAFITNSWNDDNLNEDAIHFSTIHTAKGGEWKRVFIIDVYENGIWSYTENSVDTLERLFYVAATRATKQLVLCQIGEELPWGMKL